METQLLTKELEVIGYGPMPVEPMQIGDWWVVPAYLYHSTIPVEAWQKANLLMSQVRVLGFVVADDMAKVKTENSRKEKIEKASQAGLAFGEVMAAILSAVVTVVVFVAAIVISALAYDPVLIAVLEDGRWVCVHSWYE